MAPRSPWLAIVSLCAAVTSAVSVAWEARHTALETEGLRIAMAAHRQPEPAKRVETRKSSTKSETEKLRAWNELARQLNTPWPQVFDTLESLTPESVALVLIEPDAGRGAIRLQSEARSLDELLQYAAGLRRAGPFREITLMKHEAAETAGIFTMRLTFEANLGDRLVARPGRQGEVR